MSNSKDTGLEKSAFFYIFSPQKKIWQCLSSCKVYNPTFRISFYRQIDMYAKSCLFMDIKNHKILETKNVYQQGTREVMMYPMTEH